MVKWERGRRLPPEVFALPVEKIRRGWYSDKYFVRTKEILARDNHHPRVLMQVFSRKAGVVCGIDEAAVILRLGANHSEQLKIMGLFDGDPVSINETVMTIEGDYASFAHLETVYLGVLARRTAVATAVKRVVDAAAGKMVLFFPARFDHYSLQTGDGYAAFISGALGVSTDANAAWWGLEGIGTIPHGLIAAYGGDTVKACLVFDKYMPKDVKRIALVDFENDSVKTSLEVARALKERLWGVRLDTAGDLHDVSIENKIEDNKGVCPELVWNVRRALDREGFDFVKIIISGGFNEEKIKEFLIERVPFDAVGVGSYLFQNRMDFTADVVMVNGQPCAKVGRKYNPNPRLGRI
ncbi:nicotinate phosphoribosyltransferase [candidate division KSB1 bacterium]|nr:nicotinate phosphoribosyltransferase [candidate division KSB1 bacterium]